MEDVDVLVPGVRGPTGLIAVPVPAAAAHRLRPVIAGIGGVLAGHARVQIAHRLLIHAHAVGILDVAVHGRLAGLRVLRHPPDGEVRIVPAGGAVEGLVGHDGVDVQLVGPIAGLHPVLCGIVVAVLLPGHRAGDHADTQDQRQQQRHGTAGNGMILIQVHVLLLHSIVLLQWGSFSHMALTSLPALLRFCRYSFQSFPAAGSSTVTV